MINWRAIDTGTFDWNETGVNTEYHDLVWRLLRQVEGNNGKPHWDTADPPRPTIGLGFNFHGSNPDIQDTVIELMGFDLEDPAHASYISEIVSTENSLLDSSPKSRRCS